MTRYVIRRILQAIPLIFIISLILFLLMRTASDPLATMGGRRVPRPEDRERLARQLGLDQPIYVQYLYWLVGNDWTQIDLDGDGVRETPGEQKGIMRGELGTSLVSRGKPAWDVIWERVPNTLLLMIPAEVVIIVFSLIVGVFSALRQYTLADTLITAVSNVGYSIPIFFVALVSMYLFGVKFKGWGLPYLPTVGMFDPKVGKTPSQVALHMVLPIFSIAFVSIAGYSRYVRSQMLETISQDYIRTARAKGLQESAVVFVHALKNASLPLVTIIGLDIPLLLAGALVTETIFAWPGMGRLFVDHVSRGDTPVIMGILMLVSIAVVFFQLVTDIVYAWLDPRIRYD
jgi:peptide/nickel transport system permease protein